MVLEAKEKEKEIAEKAAEKERLEKVEIDEMDLKL